MDGWEYYLSAPLPCATVLLSNSLVKNGVSDISSDLGPFSNHEVSEAGKEEKLKRTTPRWVVRALTGWSMDKLRWLTGQLTDCQLLLGARFIEDKVMRWMAALQDSVVQLIFTFRYIHSANWLVCFFTLLSSWDFYFPTTGEIPSTCTSPLMCCVQQNVMFPSV